MRNTKLLGCLILWFGLVAMAFAVGSMVGCGAKQEQTQQTRQPVYQEQPTRQDTTQQAATEAPANVANLVTNPHGRAHWNRGGYIDKTDEGETLDDLPPELYAALGGNGDVFELLVRARIPQGHDYSIHGNEIHQTATGENAGTQSNAPSATPTANPAVTGTSQGGPSTQTQTPTNSTAVDIPVAAAPGASATGGAPQANAAGPSGAATGGAQTNTPTSTGNQTNNAAVSNGTTLTPEQARYVYDNVVADGALRSRVAAALIAGGPATGDSQVAAILSLMANNPGLDRDIRHLINNPPDADGAEGGGGDGANDQS